MYSIYVFVTFLLFSSVGISKEYVTCEFRGQMGNQMWTAAAVIGYALDHDCEAIFPNIKKALGGEVNYRYFFHRLNSSPAPQGTKFHNFSEHHSHIYAPIPYRRDKNLCLHGHFESLKYFEKHSDTIRKIFAPTQEILDQIYQKYAHLLQEPTVAVHVRTYISDGRNPNQNIGGASWGYFMTAMDYFPPNTHFLVFSDAMHWTKANFPKGGRRVTFIEGNPYYIDFYFMSLCDHFIVSPESTFSWWAAYLSCNPNKIVIVADTWGGVLDNDTIPSGWMQLPKTAPFYFTKRP